MVSLISPKLIHLVEAVDGTVVENETVAVFSGVTNSNKTFYFNGTDWLEGQAKTTLNQAPLFDVFDTEGISVQSVACKRACACDLQSAFAILS